MFSGFCQVLLIFYHVVVIGLAHSSFVSNLAPYAYYVHCGERNPHTFDDAEPLMVHLSLFTLDHLLEWVSCSMS